jgi:hypothetical protein
MRIVPISLISLALLASGADAQTMYRWVDKDGKVHYSDQPPPKEIKKVDRPRISPSTIETSGVSYGAQKAAQDFPVTLYTAASCGPDCDMARAFLRKRGVPFTEKAITSADESAAFKKLFNADALYLPSISVGSLKQQGFEESSWNGMLDNAGYPRTAIPGATPAAPPESAPAPAAQ